MYEKFGGIDVLQTVEVPKLSISSNQVLVKVKAVSTNPMDWKIRKGEMKLMSGSKFPKRTGVDFAGIVEEIGNEVTNFKKGDEVFGAVNGMKEGALGEFVAVPSISLSLKPSNLSFSQAASITIAGVGAYQAMVDIAIVNSNSQVLINGGIRPVNYT
jgi:NADPH:quinone reductase-like Zn-dependent oxidoreductase